MFLRFMIFMGIFIISAVCSFIMTELHEQHPENKRYKIYIHYCYHKILSYVVLTL